MMHENNHLFRESEPQRTAPNPSVAYLRIAGVVAVSFWLASYLPAALVPTAMSQFLNIGALASATVALLIREPVDPPRVTRWDEAAILLAASLLLDGMVDPDAAAAAMEAFFPTPEADGATAPAMPAIH